MLVYFVKEMRNLIVRRVTGYETFQVFKSVVKGLELMKFMLKAPLGTVHSLLFYFNTIYDRIIG